MSKPSFPITGLHLRTRGENVEVLVEHEGVWRLVTRYLRTDLQNSEISHITEVAGLQRAPVETTRTITPSKRIVEVTPTRVGKRGWDFACEKCGKWEGSTLHEGWYRCNACGYPGK